MVILYSWKRPLKIICLVFSAIWFFLYRDTNQNTQLKQVFPKNQKKTKKDVKNEFNASFISLLEKRLF